MVDQPLLSLLVQLDDEVDRRLLSSDEEGTLKRRFELRVNPYSSGFMEAPDNIPNLVNLKREP